MKIVKNIIDDLNIDNVKVVDNSYILLVDEEFIILPSIGELLFIYNRIDYIRFRKWLKNICNNEQDILVQDERDIAVKHYVKPTALSQDAITTDDELLQSYQVEMVKLERQCRYKRLSEAKSKVAQTLSEYESFLFYNDTKTFIFDYLEAELPNLYLWLVSGAYPALGLDYTTTGFVSKSYYTAQRMNIILDVMFND